jgi:hypothetical protein
MKKYLILLILAQFSRVASAQTVVNCASGFVSGGKGACSTGIIGSGAQLYTQSAVSGSTLELLNGTVHQAANLTTQKPANIQAFTTTFTVQDSCEPNPGNCGNGFGFMIIAANSSNPYYPPGYDYAGDSGAQFSWSDRCECNNSSSPGLNCVAIDEALVKFDIYGLSSSPPSDLDLTNYYQATSGGGTCPQYGADINMHSSGIDLTSKDVFSITLTYNGSSLFETVTDTNTSARFSHTYTGINLPSVIGANTAFVGLDGGTGNATMHVNIKGWTYTVNSPGPTPTTAN